MGKLCVFACFPAGTKVHTDEGLKNIEDIQAGDRVQSYNEETGEQSLQEVLQTDVRESDHTVELYTDGEKINESGTTIVIVTHDPGIGASTDRCIKLFDGNIQSDEHQVPVT